MPARIAPEIKGARWGAFCCLDKSRLKPAFHLPLRPGAGQESGRAGGFPEYLQAKPPFLVRIYRLSGAQ